MNKLYLLIWFQLIICSAPVVFAQEAGALTGVVQDERGTAVGFATVTLLQATGAKVVAGEIADAAGRFKLKTPTPGRYSLRISLIGFTPTDMPPFEVNTVSFSKDFGIINLKQDAKALQEVTVQSMRPTITQKADRMVVSVAGTAMAAGSNAYTVLAKSPGVFIDQDGNLQLNGRSGVMVMLDGKQTYLSARDLRNLLEGMSAENLKDIEIITNPSAKYDAEGTSGIININLKKNDQQGMNGSLYTGYNYNGKQHGFTTGGNLNYKRGPWNSFLNLDMARRVGGREATFTRIFYGTEKTTYFDQVATGNFSTIGPPTVRLGTDYSLTDRHSIGFIANYTNNTGKSEFLTDTYLGSAPHNPTQYINADNYSRNTYTNYTTNLHYTGKLDTLGTLLSADLDYVKIINRGEADFFNYFTNLTDNQITQDFLFTHTPNQFDIYSGKVDFTKPFSPEKKVEAGIKASQVVSDNDSRFYFNNGPLVLDPQRTNHFYYRENIYAAYLNWSGKVRENITLQAGLRAENTQSVGESFTTGQVTQRNYLNFFPSLFMQQKVSDDYGISYSYSRRLTRPNYGRLNPFRFYRDPYTWEQGNPFLRPQYTQSFSLTQTYKKVYNLTLGYQYNRDVMAELPILDVANATTVYTTGNVDDGHNIGLTGVAPFKITKNWDSQNTLVVSYNKFSMAAEEGNLVNDQLFYMLQSNHTIQLPRELRLELNMLYRGPAASGLYLMAPMHRVDVALKKIFLNKKLDLSINANDLFKGYRFYWTTNINGNINEFDQYFRFRNIGFTLRYNFSKGQKVDVKRRNNNLDELNRT